MDELMTPAVARRRGAPLLAVAATALLAACATPRPENAAPLAVDEPLLLAAPVKVNESAMLPLLGYLQLATQFSAADLARERRTLAAIPQTPSTQVRQAIVLAQSRLSGDLSRALALLDKVYKSNELAAASLRPLVLVHMNQYFERQRLLAQNERLQSQLTDSQKRSGELQQKLDALAEVETRLQLSPLPVVP